MKAFESKTGWLSCLGSYIGIKSSYGWEFGSKDASGSK